MNKKFFIAVFALAMAGIFASAQGALAGDIKQRMKNRLPQIMSLKAKGAIGENNQGFLELRGSSGEGGSVVDAENKDRRTVYGVIAKQQGANPQVVGQRRAAQLAKIAKPGEWIQKPNGQWVKK